MDKEEKSAHTKKVFRTIAQDWAIRHTIILGHIKKSLKFQSFSVVHHPPYCVDNSSNHENKWIQYIFKFFKRKLYESRSHKRDNIPVLVNVCPLYDAQRRSSSSNPSSSRSSSSLFRSTLSRKFFHSSSKRITNVILQCQFLKGHQRTKPKEFPSTSIQGKCYRREKITWVNLL